jgi:hypothetical protein
VNIVVASDSENLKRQAAVMVAIQGHVQTGESFLSSHLSVAGQLASGEQVAIETDLGRLDVVQGLDGVPTYDELRAGAVEAEFSASESSFARSRI